MQAPKEAPPDFQCKDKFLLQCVLAKDGATTKDITTDMFEKEPGKIIDEFKLRVAYIPAGPPSPVPKETEENLSPRSSTAENGTQSSSLLDEEWSLTRWFPNLKKRMLLKFNYSRNSVRKWSCCVKNPTREELMATPSCLF